MIRKRYKGFIILIIILIVITSALTICWWYFRGRSKLEPGDNLPTITLKDSNNNYKRLNIDNEQIHFIYFFQFRCSKCREFLRKIISLKHEDKELLKKYLSLVSLDDKNYWERYSSKLMFEYSVYWDVKNEFSKILGGFQIPTLIVVKQGIVISNLTGYKIDKVDIHGLIKRIQ